MKTANSGNGDEFPIGRLAHFEPSAGRIASDGRLSSVIVVIGDVFFNKGAQMRNDRGELLNDAEMAEVIFYATKKGFAHVNHAIDGKENREPRSLDDLSYADFKREFPRVWKEHVENLIKNQGQIKPANAVEGYRIAPDLSSNPAYDANNPDKVFLRLFPVRRQQNGNQPI